MINEHGLDTDKIIITEPLKIKDSSGLEPIAVVFAIIMLIISIALNK
jgi:hypothetical protein